MILPSSHTDDRSLSSVCSGVFNSCRIVVFNYADQFYIIRLYELYLRTLNLTMYNCAIRHLSKERVASTVASFGSPVLLPSCFVRRSRNRSSRSRGKTNYKHPLYNAQVLQRVRRVRPGGLREVRGVD